MLNDYRNTYDNLKRTYEHFGQFQYSDQRDQGEIETSEDKYEFVRITSRLEENNISLIRSIAVYKEGKIEEGELSNLSEFRRWRMIYKSGLWEQYSIHYKTRFGIRKVVYPNGQEFTGEVYGRDRWNAIGEETYAIQNKSIPYLLWDNEMKEYKFVTEDGLFNTIDLR